VAQILAVKKYGYFDPETTAHVRHLALFFGAASRAGGQAGQIDFLPAYFSELPALISRGWMASDVVFAMASPMDEHGYFALSLAADYTMAAIAKARAVILEVNPNVPFAYGACHVHISQVTALTESTDAVAEVGLPKIGPVQQAIGKYVADMIEDGSTLQIGYGGIPDAVVMQLTDKKDLGIHTEMIGDGILSLIEQGVVTNHRKNFMPGKMVATLHWVHANCISSCTAILPLKCIRLILPMTRISPRRMIIWSRLMPHCKLICSDSAVRRVWHICRIRAPAGRWILSVPLTAPKRQSDYRTAIHCQRRQHQSRGAGTQSRHACHDQ
jgi:hypothetical protein